MSWLLDHAEGITLAVLVILPFVIVGLIVIAGKNTPETTSTPVEKKEPFSDFPAGAYIHIDPETNHTELATAEDHNAIADGKGGYIK